MRLPAFSVRHPITTRMIFLGIFLLGLISYLRLPIDLFPEIEPPAISVITSYPGAGAEDVEIKVTKIVEKDLSIVNNLDRIESKSQENLSLVTCIFEWGTNLDEASNEIRDRLEFSKRRLPDDVEEPMVFKFNTAMFPIMFFGVTAKESYDNLYTLIDRYIADNLQAVPGVGAVQVFSDHVRQINVNLDKGRMEAYKVSPAEIESALDAENLTLPAGNLKIGSIDYILRVPGEFESAEAVKNIVVKQYADRLVYLKDIAAVEDGFREERQKISINYGKGLVFMVQKRSGANTVEVSKRVLKRLDSLKRLLPPDVKVFTIMNNADYIEDSIRNLRGTVYWGALFVTIIVLLFLRKVQSSLVIMLTLPFSLIISFILLYVLGYTINVISLSSIAIALGMVVDNAIVVLENVTNHIERGERPTEAAIYGTSEVGKAISASTFTTVVVFLPLMFLGGITGIFFRQLALVIVLTIGASLFTALTLTPVLSSKWLRRTTMPTTGLNIYQRFYRASERAFERFQELYANILGFALKNRGFILALFALALLASGLLIKVIGTEFAPWQDTGDINIWAELPPGTKVEKTEEIAKRITEIFRSEVPEAEQVFYRAGQSEEGFSSAFGEKEGTNIAEVAARLVKKSQRTRSAKDIAYEVRKQVVNYPEVSKVTINTVNFLDRALAGAGKPLTLDILGFDLEQTDRFAREVQKLIASIPGTVDVSVSRELGKPELRIEVDRLKAASLGLTMRTIAETLRSYFYGKEATQLREGGDEYKIFLRLQDTDRTSVRDIEEITFKTLAGETVKLKNFATINEARGPVEIERKNQQRMIRVEANVHNRPIGDIAADVERGLSRMNIPPEISIEYAGEVKEQREAFKDLLLLLALGIALVYMVMASQFESLLHPFVIMFSVPFTFSGVFFFLYITGTTLNLISFLGLVMLMGIVVNNAIVLVDYTNILRARGLELFDAIKEAGRRRLRPVLMTSLTTIFGMLPLVLTRGEGSEIWRPLGIAVIGGLLVSTLVTLVLVPTIYSVLEKSKRIILKGHS